MAVNGFQVTGEIPLGSILTICTLIGIAIRLGRYFGRITQVVEDHDRRLKGYEEQMLSLVGSVQRLVGRVESYQIRAEQGTEYARRQRPRPGDLDR